MLPTTILIDERPHCVVRPNDTKALNRFLRNARPFLLEDNPEGRITHRAADETENRLWRRALALHLVCGGSDEDFFGIPL